MMGSTANVLQRSEHDLYKVLPAALASSGAWPDLPRNVRVIETHISWIFLTERHAFKLKKPVRFEFLDYSTLELRRRACFEELFLNRRLASDTYLCVVPIAQTPDGRICVQGDGTVVDWLVKMKRLPQNRALDVLIRTNGQSAVCEIAKLADKLADFYQTQPSILISGSAYRDELTRHVVGNRDELMNKDHGFDLDRIVRLHQAQLSFLNLERELLERRAAAGRIIEGHGDLRPEHIYLTAEPMVIDCIEFSREYRTLDVADELAFLSMECDFLGESDLAAPIIERYCLRTGDQFSRELLDFYRLYRACVRAKVAAIRAEQPTVDSKNEALSQAERYLNLADQYAQSIGPPLMIIMQGSPGTGKSTVAARLARELGIEHIQSDAVRREMFGASDDELGFCEGRYSDENRFRVYEEMNRRADDLLRRGLSVILDATYLASHHRNGAKDTAKRHRATALVVRCTCPREIALRRVQNRQSSNESLSDARADIFDRWDTRKETSWQGMETVQVDTTREFDSELRKVFVSLKQVRLSQKVRSSKNQNVLG